jgi:PAS domain S-box-containing protein
LQEVTRLRQQLAALATVKVEHAHVTEASRANERRFRALIEHSSEAIALVAADGTVLYVSPASSRLFGHAGEETVGHQVFKFTHPDDLVFLRGQLVQLRHQPDTPVTAQYRICHKNGSWRWIEARWQNLLADADVQAMVVNYRDITERKQAEEMLAERAQQLAESEYRLRTLIESEPECVKLVAADGTVLQMNAAGLTMVEAERAEQILGHSVYSLLVPEYHDVFRALNEAIFRGESRTAEFEILGYRGTRCWVETHASPLRDAAGNIFAQLAIARDITARKRAEEALQQAKEAVEAANQLKDDFLATISHELRTPLSIVMGYTNLLLEGSFGPLTAKQQATLHRVKKAAFTELELVSALLEATTLDTGHMPLTVHPVQLSDLCAEVLAETRDLLHGKPQLQLVGPAADLPPLQTDRAKLKIVLKNLLGNAVKFTERGTIPSAPLSATAAWNSASQIPASALRRRCAPSCLKSFIRASGPTHGTMAASG